MKRRLVTVWFADIVGFTELSSTDESAALQLVELLQRTTRDAVSKTDGRIVKFTGDGAMGYGESPATVIHTMLGILEDFTSRSREGGLPGRLRVGVHLGDISVSEDGDIYGDGVNVAARIQGEAEPGQIAVSEDVWRLTRQIAEFRFEPLGRRRLKGKPDPIELHSVTRASKRPTPRPDHRAEGPAVAVLPFEIVGVGPDAEFLASGLHNDLLTELSRVAGITVISRTSVRGYAGRNVPIPQIAAELGVDTIVEGSIQSAGSRIRLNVQLIDAASDAHKWAEYYDRQISTDELFDIQTELAERIVGSLATELVPGARTQGRPQTESLEAYRLSVEGRMQFDLKTEASFLRAIELFERAVEIDPDFALAWVGLADSLALMEDYGYGDSTALLRRAEAAAERAMELAPDSAEAHTSMGLLRTSYQDGPGALAQYERAIELRPGYADAHSWRAWVSFILGDRAQARESAGRSVELNPLSAEAVSNYAFALLITGDAEDAVTQARRSASLSVSYTTDDFYEGLALQELGRHHEAIEVLRPLSVAVAGESTVPWAGQGPDAALAISWWETGDHDEALRIIDSIDPVTAAFDRGLALAAIGRVEDAWEAFARVERTTAWHNMALHDLHADVWARLSTDPRYDELRRTADESWDVPAG